MFKRIAVILILLTWPISLLANNTTPNFLNYFIPAILILISYLLHRKNNKYYFIPLLLIPFIQPKLLLIPLLFALLNFKKSKWLYLVLSTILVLIFAKPFWGQTIFIRDYQQEQQVLQKSNLYPSIFLARLFQNKPRIVINKFTNNFFSLVDPNNYFFGFAPGQIKIDNQNLDKFPFFSLPFFLVGLYYIFQNKNYKIILSLLTAIILNLSILTNFDRNDFILWIPVSLVIISGFTMFNKKFKYTKIYGFIFVIGALIGIIRILI